MNRDIASTGRSSRSRQAGDDDGRPSLWDPTNALPSARIIIWALITALVVIAQGPSFIRSLKTTWHEGNDFFQDWASARNVLQGRPAYSPLSDALALYYPQVDGKGPPPANLPWNAHPPTSVLAVLPLALLDYPQAGTVWNILTLIALVASIGFIARELRLPLRAWSILPILTLGLLCSPVRTQISQGQWNAPILLLLTLAWTAGRHGRDTFAGLCVGAAVTLKLFPVFFLLQFAIERRWRALIAGCLCVVTLSLVTIAIVGLDAFQDYNDHVLPTLHEFRSGWANASMPAFWTKNFGTGASHYGLFIEPVIKLPALAQAGIVLSYAAVLATTSFFVNASRSISKTEPAFGNLCCALTTVTMLLLVPICWDHYLLLLALPLALIWVGLGNSSVQRLGLLLLVIAVWIGPNELWRAGGVNLLADWPDFHEVPPRTYQLHRPFFIPVFLSIHFYALFACFAWIVCLARRQISSARP